MKELRVRTPDLRGRGVASPSGVYARNDLSMGTLYFTSGWRKAVTYTACPSATSPSVRPSARSLDSCIIPVAGDAGLRAYMRALASLRFSRGIHYGFICSFVRSRAVKSRRARERDARGLSISSLKESAPVKITPRRMRTPIALTAAPRPVTTAVCLPRWLKWVVRVPRDARLELFVL